MFIEDKESSKEDEKEVEDTSKADDTSKVEDTTKIDEDNKSQINSSSQVNNHLTPQTNIKCTKCAVSHVNDFFWQKHEVFICMKTEKDMYKLHEKCEMISMIFSGVKNRKSLGTSMIMFICNLQIYLI